MAEWRPILSDARYEVSEEGQVRSSARGAARLLAVCTLRTPQGKEYAVVQIRPLGGLKYAHRLVLEAFVGPCPDGHEGRHLDDDGMNCRLGNLAWGTRRQNAEDRRRNGAYRAGSGSAHKLTEGQVRTIRSAEGSHASVAARYGVTPEQISNIRRGKSWRWLDSARGT